MCLSYFCKIEVFKAFSFCLILSYFVMEKKRCDNVLSFFSINSETNLKIVPTDALKVNKNFFHKNNNKN